MPLAGNKPGDRAIAHIRTAQRYAKPGNPNDIRKAVAHVSRALDYSAIKQQHFGANDDEEEVEAYVEKSNAWTWVKATSKQKAAFNKAMGHISHDSQVVSWMPRLPAQEHKEGAVYDDKNEPLIFWYVGSTGHMTPLRRRGPLPTSAWVFTPADYERARAGEAAPQAPQVHQNETQNKKRKL